MAPASDQRIVYRFSASSVWQARFNIPVRHLATWYNVRFMDRTRFYPSGRSKLLWTCASTQS